MTAPRLRKTKIIATVGPASDAIETLERMIAAGMDVARLNLSFGTFADHLDRISRIRAAAERKGANIAVMADTRGIEIRTGKVTGGAVTLTPGARFTLYTDGRVGDIEGVSVSCRRLPEEVTCGTPILLDDGAIELEVESTGADSVRCKVIAGATLRDHKGVNLPATPLPRSVLDGHDRELLAGEIRFAAEADVDYIAASFVQNAGDVEGIREVLREHGTAIPIIAKIENRAGLANLDAIVQVADGIMVARGDLGVELPLAEVPATQKHMIHTTVMNGKPVITATQMLASMEIHPRPTRAEASDVANAILDGTSAIMLSGETAAGKFPVEAVRTMAELALRAEAHLREYGYLQKDPTAPLQRGDGGRQPGVGRHSAAVGGGRHFQPHRDGLHLETRLQAPPRLPDPRDHRLTARRQEARHELGRFAALVRRRRYRRGEDRIRHRAGRVIGLCAGRGHRGGDLRPCPAGRRHRSDPRDHRLM